MQWLRTIRRFVRVLAALFVVAQFAGVVPSPLTTTASSSVGTAHMHHHHAHADQLGSGPISDSHDRAKHHADPCCGLHAFFTGVLPALIVVDPVDRPHKRLSVGLDDVVVGIDPGRLDRPPRPPPVI